jgi:hypothetical protein
MRHNRSEFHIKKYYIISESQLSSKINSQRTPKMRNYHKKLYFSGCVCIEFYRRCIFQSLSFDPMCCLTINPFNWWTFCRKFTNASVSGTLKSFTSQFKRDRILMKCCWLWLVKREKYILSMEQILCSIWALAIDQQIRSRGIQKIIERTNKQTKHRRNETQFPFLYLHTGFGKIFIYFSPFFDRLLLWQQQWAHTKISSSEELNNKSDKL